MEIHNVHLIVNLEFILSMANVFTAAMEVAAKPSITPTAALPATKTMAAPSIEKEDADLKLHFVVQNPEIVLLADAKDKDTNALFLNVCRRVNKICMVLPFNLT